MSPVSLAYWGIPGYVIFWVLSVAAVSLFLWRAYRLWRYLRLGSGWGGSIRLPGRLLTALFHVVAQ